MDDFFTMTTLTWKITEVIKETQVGDMVYRIIINDRGVRAQRTQHQAVLPLWHHSILCQTYDRNENRFRAQSMADVKYFANEEEAIEEINRVIASDS